MNFPKVRGILGIISMQIENFWGLAKVRLSKFRGMSKSKLYLHLKEYEFRFNYRDEDLYKLVLKILRDRSLNCA